MKKYLISFGIFVGLILITALFINIFYYYNLINTTVYKIIIIITISIITFISSYLLGKKTKEKGYLEGIKFSLIIIALMFILSIIFKNLSLNTIIYYLIIVLSSITGSSIGINKKKD